MQKRETPEEQLLQDIVSAIVERPEEISIERSIDEQGVLLRLRVAQPDMGRLLGREGSTAKAIRTVMRVLGGKYDARINVKIDEPDTQSNETQTE